MSKIKIAATHYLHHSFKMEQNGKTMQIWRQLPRKSNDCSAAETGDIRRIVRA